MFCIIAMVPYKPKLIITNFMIYDIVHTHCINKNAKSIKKCMWEPTIVITPAKRNPFIQTSDSNVLYYCIFISIQDNPFKLKKKTPYDL